MTTLLERELQDKEMARLFAQEDLIEEAGELIAGAMGREDISKAELARRMGTSKAHITQLLSGSRNMTLRTFADVMYAMDERVLVTSTPIAENRYADTMCWVVQAPRANRHDRWEETELFIGASGQAA